MSDRDQQMLSLYEQGLSLQEIADRFDLTRERVRQILAAQGYTPHGGVRRRDERIDRLREAHQRIVGRESTTAEEARRLGYANANTFRDALWRLGLHVALENHEPPHGTATRYESKKHRCRCDDCRRAMREARREMREQGPKKHGTSSGYKNYGCRCLKCKRAWNRYQRNYRARQRQRKEPTL